MTSTYIFLYIVTAIILVSFQYKVVCFKAILFYIRVFKTLSYNAWYIVCFLNAITDHMTDNALTVSAQRLAYFYFCKFKDTIHRFTSVQYQCTLSIIHSNVYRLMLF